MNPRNDNDMHEAWDLPDQYFHHHLTQDAPILNDWEELCNYTVSSAYMEKVLWKYLKNFPKPKKMIQALQVRNYDPPLLISHQFIRTVSDWANMDCAKKEYFNLESLCFLYFLKSQRNALFGISDTLKFALVEIIPDFLTDFLYIFNSQQLDLIAPIFFVHFQPCNLSSFESHRGDYSIFYYKMLSIYIKKIYQNQFEFAAFMRETLKTIFTNPGDWEQYESGINVHELFAEFNSLCKYKHDIVDRNAVNLYEIPIQAYYDKLLYSKFWDEYFLKIVSIGPKTLVQEVIYNLVTFDERQLKNQADVFLDDCYFFVNNDDIAQYKFNQQYPELSMNMIAQKSYQKKQRIRTLQDFYFIANYEYGLWLKTFSWDLRIVTNDECTDAKTCNQKCDHNSVYMGKIEKNRKLFSDLSIKIHKFFKFTNNHGIPDCLVLLNSWVPEKILPHFFTDTVECLRYDGGSQSHSEFLWEFLLRFPIIMIAANVAPPLNIPHSRIPQKRIDDSYLWLKKRQFLLQRLPLKYLIAFAKVIHKFPPIFLSFIYIFPEHILISVCRNQNYNIFRDYGLNLSNRLYQNIIKFVAIPEQRYYHLIKLWKYLPCRLALEFKIVKMIGLEPFLQYSILSKHLNSDQEIAFLKLFPFHIHKLLEKQISYIFELRPSTLQPTFNLYNTDEKIIPFLLCYYNMALEKNIDDQMLKTLLSELYAKIKITTNTLFFATLRYSNSVTRVVMPQFESTGKLVFEHVSTSLLYWARGNILTNHFIDDVIKIEFFECSSMVYLKFLKAYRGVDRCFSAENLIGRHGNLIGLNEVVHATSTHLTFNNSRFPRRSKRIAARVINELLKKKRDF